jgi:hypothetical protein
MKDPSYQERRREYYEKRKAAGLTKETADRRERRLEWTREYRKTHPRVYTPETRARAAKLARGRRERVPLSEEKKAKARERTKAWYKAHPPTEESRRIKNKWSRRRRAKNCTVGERFVGQK